MSRFRKLERIYDPTNVYKIDNCTCFEYSLNSNINKVKKDISWEKLF